MFEHIFVATDFSDSADAALAVAIGVAEKFEARITLVHACEPPTYAYMGLMTTPVDLVTPLHEAAREALAKALGDLKHRHERSQSLLLFGVVAVELLGAIEKHKPELVVMGTHGRTGMSHLLLGSVAERIVRSSPVPVLTVKGRK
jgi:nucleotide-binding universal stress UspA family protein